MPRVELATEEIVLIIDALLKVGIRGNLEEVRVTVAKIDALVAKLILVVPKQDEGVIEPHQLEQQEVP